MPRPHSHYAADTPHGNDAENRDALRAAGLRATAQRLAVLHAFDEAAGHHLSADDVHRHHAVAEAGVDRSTAYRILANLVAVGIIKEVRFHDGVSRFEVQRRDHHHAVCTRCGATVDVTADAMRALRRHLAVTSGFVLSDDPQLFAGLCKVCSAR